MEVLGMCFTLCKKVFSVAPVNFFQGLNKSDSVVFGNADFGEIKDHSLTTTPFQKVSFYVSMCLPYVIMYFQRHQ